MSSNAVLMPEEVEVIKEMADRVCWPSQFKFLKNHNGFRPGCLHTILGATHGGKSTLIRSILIDTLLSNRGEKKIALWLSEESRLDFLTEFVKTNIDNKFLKNLHIYSEQDEMDKIKTPKDAFNLFEKCCGDAGLVILDNITTSTMYMDKLPGVQSEVSKAYKRFAFTKNIPVILVAHTRTGIGDNYANMITGDDIRGSRALVNMSQFFYVLQSFHVGQTIYPTLRITKHRGQEVNHSLYMLRYSRKSRVYVEDKELMFEDFKNTFKQRNKL